MFIQVNRMGDSITGSVNGKPFGVKYTDEKFIRMQELEKQASTATSMQELQDLITEFEPLTHENYEEVIAHSKGGQYLFVNGKGQFFLRMPGSQVDVAKEPVPAGLVSRIIESVEKNIDVLPLVKFWMRTLRMPIYTAEKGRRLVTYVNTLHTNQNRKQEMLDAGFSAERAHEMATVFQTAITLEGLLCTYKVSRERDYKFVADTDNPGQVKSVLRHGVEVDEDTGLVTYKKSDFVEDRVFAPVVMGDGGDAFYCGTKLGHSIRVGQTHFLDSEDKVDAHDDRICVKGLHVGNLDYIRGYQSEGTETHLVFVDPMDVRAVPLDATGAIRCKRYFVHSSFAGVTKNLYNSSSYAAIMDADFENFLEESLRNEESRTSKTAFLQTLK